jgi:DNA-binding NarL/FixJ family response regulator
MNDNFYITPLIANGLVSLMFKSGQSRLPTIDDLTARQREILQLVAEGFSAKEIAEQLQVSHRTVEFHKVKIMEQLDLHTVADLVKYAIAHGVITAS